MPEHQPEAIISKYNLVSKIATKILSQANTFTIQNREPNTNSDYILTFDDASIAKLENTYDAMIDLIDNTDKDLRCVLVYFNLCIWHQWFTNWYINHIINSNTISHDMFDLNDKLTKYAQILSDNNLIQHTTTFNSICDYDRPGISQIVIDETGHTYNELLANNIHVSGQRYYDIFIEILFDETTLSGIDTYNNIQNLIPKYNSKLNTTWFKRNQPIFDKFNQRFNVLLSSPNQRLTLL